MLSSHEQSPILSDTVQYHRTSVQTRICYRQISPFQPAAGWGRCVEAEMSRSSAVQCSAVQYWIGCSAAADGEKGPKGKSVPQQQSNYRCPVIRPFVDVQAG